MLNGEQEERNSDLTFKLKQYSYGTKRKRTG